MLLEIRRLVKQYQGNMFNREGFMAVNDISFDMRQGEILGLMGHSGCGKTTTAKMAASLIKPSSGTIVFNGKSILKGNRREQKQRRRDLQIIFQNPRLVLNPGYNVRQQLAEPLKLFSLAGTKRKFEELIMRSLDSVGLSSELLERYPNEISGGQAQRVAIARALSLSPRLLIADEATSMLDLSVQAQIIELFKEIHKKHGVSIMMISHDKSVVEHFCDRVIVMEKGRILKDYNNKQQRRSA
ncbi:MAG: dipeptide/oligopeptide/nickel ABC transporter ATP-binding protein [Treponema sp.]|jgi:ABC-type glutathione transport system ATPase component|nr:dipeptide/oligopeptide/nickel ABC transporter ATP-binding protein [Treponema sp.]